MAIWYEVEKTEAGIYNFMEGNWHFHDFRIEKIEYIQEMSMVNYLLIYDDEKHGVILKFDNVSGLGIRVCDDYLTDYLYGCKCVIKDGHFFWYDAEDLKPGDINTIKRYCNWVECERIYWAVTDGYGTPTEMPDDRIDQVWNVWGKTEYHHFDFPEYKGPVTSIESTKWKQWK